MKIPKINTKEVVDAVRWAGRVRSQFNRFSAPLHSFPEQKYAYAVFTQIFANVVIKPVYGPTKIGPS